MLAGVTFSGGHIIKVSERVALIVAGVLSLKFIKDVRYRDIAPAIITRCPETVADSNILYGHGDNRPPMLNGTSLESGA